MIEQTRPWLSHYDAEVPSTLVYPDALLSDLLDKAAQRWPQRTALIFQAQNISYAQLQGLTDAFAAALCALGVQKGNRVALILPNLPQFVIAFYGALKAGAVVMPLNPAYKESELAFYLTLTGAKCALCQTETLPRLQAVQSQTQVAHLIVTEPGDAFSLNFQPSPAPSSSLSNTPLLFTDLIASQIGQPRPTVAVTAQDTALLAATGGTTGTAKVAQGSHKSLVANTVQFRQWVTPWQEGQEVMLTLLPLFHLFGMVVAMSVGVILGAAQVLITNSRDIGAVAAAIEAHQATLMPAVPVIFQALNRYAANDHAHQLRSLRWAISGAAALPQSVKEDFERLTHCRLVEGYGLSEAMVVTHCNPLIGKSPAGSIGLPLPDVKAQIVSLADGETPQPPGALGELVVNSPAMMEGYYARPDETALALHRNWLHTGDVGFMDSEGYFYLVDRQKDLIKVGGLQVWPREVEEAIMELPQVAEAAVAGVPHPEYGEMVKAWVALKPGQALSAEEVRARCLERLAAYKAPRAVTFVAQLPRSAAGKVLRRELVRQHLEHLPVASA